MSGPDAGTKMNKVQAMQHLVAWAKSNATVQALEAMEILDLSDEELDLIFRTRTGAVKIPHFGRIS